MGRSRRAGDGDELNRLQVGVGCGQSLGGTGPWPVVREFPVSSAVAGLWLWPLASEKLAVVAIARESCLWQQIKWDLLVFHEDGGLRRLEVPE